MSLTEKVCAGLVAVLLVSAGWITTRGSQEHTLRAVADTGRVVPEDPVVSTTATTPTTVQLAPTTTSATSPPTTSTTVRVVRTPPTTRAPRPAPVVTAAVPAPVAPAAPVEQSDAGRCQAAREWAAAHGLSVPAGWDYRCPDSAAIPGGSPHWGLACFNCEDGSFVGINIGLIGSSDAALRYVVAHEICHAIDFVTLGVTTELTADLCAALHGAPRP